MGAQEPPAAAVAWLLERLARSPRLAARFLSSEPDPLRASIVRETLRLNPPAGAVMRRLTEPLPAGSWELPGGTDVMIPILLVHRDRRLYPSPERFLAERFEGREPRAGAYLPFGGGARRCLGEPLALLEMEAAVPAVLRRLRLRPVSLRGERMVLRGTVLVPRHGGLMVAVAR